MSLDWSKIYNKHKGDWVALAEDEVTVIAAGRTAKAVRDIALQKGYDKPLLAHIPEELVTYVGLAGYKHEVQI